jgi:ParB-like chromosome segregation protein Spo0J
MSMKLLSPGDSKHEHTQNPDAVPPPLALTIHPVADEFPRLEGDEFAALMADIKQNGLREPILLDHTGSMLIDGRNREQACRLAGVEPQYKRLPLMSR